MSRPFAYSLLALGLFFVLFVLGLAFPFQTVALLLAGWATFLIRVLPATTVDFGGVATALVCLALLAVLGHNFGRWLVEQLAPGSRWRKRWTAALIGGVVLMFVAGIAAAGMGHQVGWLLTSREPWVESSMRRLVQRIQSASNLRQIGLGLTGYSNQSGQFPPGATFDADGTPLHGWPTLILPWADNLDLRTAIDINRPWDDTRRRGEVSNRTVTSKPISIYKPPGIASDQPLLGYASNAWVMGGDRPRRLDSITDGLANTILAGEAAGDYKPWGSPVHWRDPALGINRSPAGFGSPYPPGGANFLFADGSVKFLKSSIAPRVFEAVCTPTGGEKISADQY